MGLFVGNLFGVHVDECEGACVPTQAVWLRDFLTAPIVGEVALKLGLFPSLLYSFPSVTLASPRSK